MDSVVVGIVEKSKLLDFPTMLLLFFPARGCPR